MAGGHITGPDENAEQVSLDVTGVRDGVASLDGNHPLAGQTLVFEVEIQAIRDATDEELRLGEVIS